MAVCLDCGSIEWREDYADVTFHSKINKHGQKEEIDAIYGDQLGQSCAQCHSKNLETDLTESDIDKLPKMTNEERIQYAKQPKFYVGVKIPFTLEQIIRATNLEEAQQKALDLEPDDFDNFHRFYDFVGDEYRKLKRKNMEVRQW